MSSFVTTQILVKNEPAVDTYHGVQVVDPFRWLEEHQSSDSRAWIDEQSKAARRYLEALPGRDSLHARVAQWLDQENFGEMYVVEDSIFYMKRRADEQQPKLYRREGLNGSDSLLLDPELLGDGNTLSITILDVSTDRKLLAYGLRSGGQGARRVRILDLETLNTLPDELPKSAIRSFAFLSKSNGFIYVTEEVGKPDQPKTAKCHIIGRPIERDKTVFYAGRSGNLRLVGSFDRSSCCAVHTVVRAVSGRNLTSVHLQMLCRCGDPLLTLVENSAESWDVRVHDEYIYVFTDLADGLGRRLMRTPLSSPDLAKAETIVFENAQRFQNWRLVGNFIIIVRVEDLANTIDVYMLDGRFVRNIDLPTSSSAGIVAGDNNGCFIGIESYGRPREVWYYRYVTNSLSLFSQPSLEVKDLAVSRCNYQAKDGTSIPMTLLGRPDVIANRHAPVLLTAYGAAGVSLTPRHSVLAMCFVQLGGIFAIAHIRGGGEYGSAWEEAGKRKNRPTVHEDFISAAEFLSESGIADPTRISIAGGSNSGLLVGTAMTKRPDLFCAVLCIAPFTDMLRYHRFNNTQFYVPCFGTSDDANDFQVLLSYSPYHNIREGVRYPPVLMVSGDKDTRCDPMHAKKFVARLQAAMSLVAEAETSVILDWDPMRGHFATLSHETRLRAIVDRLAFLAHHLKMEVA